MNSFKHLAALTAAFLMGTSLVSCGSRSVSTNIADTPIITVTITETEPVAIATEETEATSAETVTDTEAVKSLNKETAPTVEETSEAVEVTSDEGYPVVDDSYVAYHFRSKKQLNEHFEKLIAGDSRSVCSLDKLNRVQLECISRFIAKAQFDPSLIEKENYDPAMSFAACTNNEVQGFILAKKIGSEIFVTLLLAHDNNIPAITQIFGSFLKNAESRNIKKITFIVSYDTILNNLSRIFKDELKTTDNVCSALLSI